MRKSDSATLLLVGAIGFLLGFLAWLFWLLLTASALLSFYLGYGYPTYMSGIFFQSRTHHLIFRSLLAPSLALEGCGCLGLQRKYGSHLASACGIFLFATAAVLTSALVLPLSTMSNLLWVISYNPAVLLHVGLLVLGLTFLSLRTSLPTPRKASWIGSIFVTGSALTLTGFASVILYWGFELWLLFFGGPYAITSLVTSWLMIHLRTA